MFKLIIDQQASFQAHTVVLLSLAPVFPDNFRASVMARCSILPGNHSLRIPDSLRQELVLRTTILCWVLITPGLVIVFSGESQQIIDLHQGFVKLVDLTSAPPHSIPKNSRSTDSLLATSHPYPVNPAQGFHNSLSTVLTANNMKSKRFTLFFPFKEGSQLFVQRRHPTRQVAKTQELIFKTRWVTAWPKKKPHPRNSEICGFYSAVDMKGMLFETLCYFKRCKIFILKL